jgi:hypothetical protein
VVKIAKNLLIGGERIIAIGPGQVVLSCTSKSQWNALQCFKGLSLYELERILERTHPVELLPPPTAPLFSQNIIDLPLATVISLSLVEYCVLQ